ncbi:hypothetical protein [Nocardia sp. bgisy134]|uniref:hypothetical protein n=1 Tax=Nocardia sp. bgisy134 TaxID=3413789 RepID=UPI003D72CDAC
MTSIDGHLHRVHANRRLNVIRRRGTSRIERHCKNRGLATQGLACPAWRQARRPDPKLPNRNEYLPEFDRPNDLFGHIESEEYV